MHSSSPVALPSPRLAPLAGEQITGRGSNVHASAGVLVRWVQHRPVVYLDGDIDLTTAAQISSVGRFLGRWAHPAAVDAAAVSFIDVAGLRSVLALAGASNTVEVRYPSWAVLRLLRVLDEAGAGVQVSRAPGPRPALMLSAPISD